MVTEELDELAVGVFIGSPLGAFDLGMYLLPPVNGSVYCAVVVFITGAACEFFTMKLATWGIQ